MAYVVRAINTDGVTGTFAAKMNTRRGALELAKRLREEGLWVIITGPDGKTVDETRATRRRPTHLTESKPRANGRGLPAWRS
jgi:hypothetical protein